MNPTFARLPDIHTTNWHIHIKRGEDMHTYMNSEIQPKKTKWALYFMNACTYVSMSGISICWTHRQIYTLYVCVCV